MTKRKKPDAMARLRFIVDTETVGVQPGERIMRAVRALLRERAELACGAVTHTISGAFMGAKRPEAKRIQSIMDVRIVGAVHEAILKGARK